MLDRAFPEVRTKAAWSRRTPNGGNWVDITDGNANSHVNQDKTGYDSVGVAPDGTDSLDTAWDRRANNKKTDDSRTITAFSIPGAPNVTNTQARSGIYSNSRYSAETVSVNLGTATALEGGGLEWE